MTPLYINLLVEAARNYNSLDVMPEAERNVLLAAHWRETYHRAEPFDRDMAEPLNEIPDNLAYQAVFARIQDNVARVHDTSPEVDAEFAKAYRELIDHALAYITPQVERAIADEHLMPTSEELVA